MNSQSSIHLVVVGCNVIRIAKEKAFIPFLFYFKLCCVLIEHREGS
jgi:hypothetical protein